MSFHFTFKLSLIVSFIIFQLIGLAPFFYNSKTQRFEKSLVYTLYSCFIFFIFSITYTKLYIQILNHLDYSSIQTVRNIAIPYLIISTISVYLIYLTQIILRYKYVKAFNLAKKSYNRINYFLEEDYNASRYIVIAFIIKLFIFPFLIEFGIIIKFWHMENTIDIKYSLLLFIPYFIRTAIPSCMYAAFILSQTYLKVLNKHLEKIFHQIDLILNHEDFKNEKNYYKMKIFCELSDKIDFIHESYKNVLQLTTICMEIGSLPLLLSMLCNFYIVIIDIFMEYIKICDSVLNGKDYQIIATFSTLIHSIIAILDIFLIGLITQQTVSEVKR